MSKIIFIYFLFISACFADYIVFGTGLNKGEAYVSAMSKAPSGKHWILNRIFYSPNQQECMIVWTEK